MRRFLPVFLLVSLIGIAAYPLWTPGQLFYTDDGLLHLFRAFALDRTIHAGVAYPRWVLDLAYGLGYPIFNFYPPLAAYMVEALHLIGAGFPEALNGAFIGIVALAAFGAYAMGTELCAGERDAKTAAILTAVVYIFFPYFIINIYIRGALAEALAMAILPWLVWSLHRLLIGQTLGSLVLTATMLTALLLAHSMTLLIVAPILGLYTLWQLTRIPAATRLRAFRLLGISALLSMGLGAFYWLPFISELPLVKMGAGIEAVRGFFQSPVHFLPLTLLIQSSPLYQYGSAPFALGLVAVIFSVLAIVVALAAGKRYKQWGSIIFLAMIFVSATWF